VKLENDSIFDKNRGQVEEKST